MDYLSTLISCENISVNFFSFFAIIWWIIIGFVIGYKYKENQCKKLKKNKLH